MATFSSNYDSCRITERQRRGENIIASLSIRVHLNSYLLSRFEIPKFSRLFMSDGSAAPIRVVVVGSGSCGKTQLVNRFCNDDFSTAYSCTIGVDFTTRTVDVCDSQPQRKLQIWDTAGQVRFRASTAAYYRGCRACILCVDPTDDGSSLRQAQEQLWKELAAHCDLRTCSVAVALTKMDLDRSDAQSQLVADIEGWAEGVGATAFRTSAKLGQGINELFDHLITNFISDPPAAHVSVGTDLATSLVDHIKQAVGDLWPVDETDVYSSFCSALLPTKASWFELTDPSGFDVNKQRTLLLKSCVYAVVVSTRAQMEVLHQVLVGAPVCIVIFQPKTDAEFPSTDQP